MWKKKKKLSGKNRYYYLKKKLKRENKITDEFEVMLNSLSLEEIIGLKLELAADVVGGKLYGVPIWKTMPTITKDAVLKYAYSAARTKREAARFLGLNLAQFSDLIKKYHMESYFSENEN